MSGFLMVVSAVLIAAAMVLFATDPRDNATAAIVLGALAIGLLLFAV